MCYAFASYVGLTLFMQSESIPDPPASLWVVLVGVLMFAVGVGVILWMISRSVITLRQGAQRFSRGDLSQQIAVTGPLQLASLAESLNTMAKQLDIRLSTLVQQRNEIDAILSSMVEGVVAIDLDERVISLNRAASELLHVNAHEAIGRSIQEVVRNSAVHDLVRQTFRTQAAVESEATLSVGADVKQQRRDVQIQSALLHNAAAKHIGIVVVLHDVTQLRRLESVRREFVSNVSHEIRTPIAAIKAAVETLMEISEADDQNAKNFMAIIARQADRLAAIVDDLLSLTRIERDAQETLASLTQAPLRPVMQAAMETCQSMAKDKQMVLQLKMDKEIQTHIHAAWLEQALTNLIDNAIKYSPEGRTIVVSASEVNSEVLLSVADQGRGIEPQHLDRVFERFYRTDKARSRAMGGTGLGLSIVKHIAEAHGGRVSVQSTPGRGSVFSIYLPLRHSPNADER